MALPTTNLGISDIFYQANPSASGVSNLSLTDIAGVSYFEGPNGTNAYPYNYWGVNGSIGASGSNRIYGQFQRTSNYQMTYFRGLTYFYDNSSFLVKVNFTNNLNPNAPFPPPGTNNDITISATLYDSTYTYTYGVSGSGLVLTNGGTYNATISQTSSPIIYKGYWKVELSPSPQLQAGAKVDISINGTNYVLNSTINAGPSPTTFSGATLGSPFVGAYSPLGGTGLLIVVTCHT
jgi:hypothetical protein